MKKLKRIYNDVFNVWRFISDEVDNGLNKFGRYTIGIVFRLFLWLVFCVLFLVGGIFAFLFLKYEENEN